MSQEEKDVSVGELKNETRVHFRDYLRVTEITAVMILIVVIVVGVTFRGSSPITVTTSTQKTFGESSSGSPLIQKPVETERFVMTNLGKVDGSVTENIATADPEIFKSPENFKSFSYDASLGKKIAIGGSCKDTYYTLLVFKSVDDYRKDPARAYYNTAYPCPASGIVTAEINLKDFNLLSGSYYLFIADQGEKGSWYNPR